MKLNLGCGDYPLDGFVNLDKRSGWRFENGLDDVEDASVEAITVSHALMYVELADWPRVFKEMARVLEPGGILRVTEDNTVDLMSDRFGGWHDAITLTSPALVREHFLLAGLNPVCSGDSKTFWRDRSLIQAYHGAPPKVFHMEGQRPANVVPKKMRAKAKPKAGTASARVSVIVPTIGRDTLQRTLHSCAAADEVIVVLDSKAQLGELNGLAASVTATVEGGDHGYTARTLGMSLATGTHLAFLDDDDVYTPEAISLFRSAACERPVIFRMDHPDNGLFWRSQELRFGNVGTPMFLVPNNAPRLGVWERHQSGRQPGGDFTFIKGCVDQMGAPLWREEVVARVNPSNGKG